MLHHSIYSDNSQVHLDIDVHERFLLLIISLQVQHMFDDYQIFVYLIPRFCNGTIYGIHVFQVLTFACFSNRNAVSLSDK